MAEKPTLNAPRKTKPLAKGRRWKQLNGEDFASKYPRLGAARALRREALKEEAEGPSAAKRKRRLLYRYPGRLAPTLRKGAKFSAVMLPLEAHMKLREVAKFYQCSMSSILTRELDRLFDETYKEAELLVRIENNRIRNETPDPAKPQRRYNV